MRRRRLVSLMLLWPGVAGAGQPGALPPAETEAPWTFSADLSLWYAAPGGRFFLPGEVRGGRDIDVEQLNLDSPRISPYAGLRAQRAEWSIAISAAHFSSERETISPVSRPIGDIDITTGDTLRTDMRYTTLDALVGYTFFARDLYAPADPGPRVRLELEGRFGARLDALDIELENLEGGAASADEIFPSALLGLEARLDLPGQTSLGLALEFGGNPGLGDQTALVTDLQAVGAWRPTPNLELHAGYRLSVLDLTAGAGIGEFKYEGSYAGLLAGLTLRF
ncbi:MAG: hypothetical protein ACF8R7_01565 [Phycisphaerales bacterium JB039]